MANTTKTASGISGAASSNAYGAENTKDYSKDIVAQYDKLVSDRDSTADAAIDKAAENLGTISEAVDQVAQENLAQAEADRKEIIATERGIETNNGNRQRIGHSQYGIADSSYDQQRAAIEGYRKQLQTDISRQVSDLKAQGEYEQANAALAAAQEKFKQLYADQLRLDMNLRGNYEYQTGLAREDAEIQRTQDRYKQSLAREDAEIQRAQTEADKAWSRQLGEYMLSHGVVPDEKLLAAMGINSSAAKLYTNTLTSGYGYSSGGGGGNSSGSGYSSGGSSGGSNNDDDNTTPSYVLPVYDNIEDPDTGSDENIAGSISNYSSSVANRVFEYAATGNLKKALDYLGDHIAYFSQANMASVAQIAQKKYDEYTEKKYKQYTVGNTISSGSSTKSNTSSKSKSTAAKSTKTTTNTAASAYTDTASKNTSAKASATTSASAAAAKIQQKKKATAAALSAIRAKATSALSSGGSKATKLTK